MAVACETNLVLAKSVNYNFKILFYYRKEYYNLKRTLQS